MDVENQKKSEGVRQGGWGWGMRCQADLGVITFAVLSTGMFPEGQIQGTVRLGAEVT